MPAIRYMFNACTSVVQDTPTHNLPVEVKDKSGEWVRITWAGFICEAGARLKLDGRYGKMKALYVSPDDGIVSENWRRLKANEFVLCVIVPYNKIHRFAAYAVIDRDGWPIVMSEGSPTKSRAAA